MIPAMPALSLSPSLLAHQAVFRCLPGAGRDGRIGCGILLKPAGWDARDALPETLSAVLCLRGSGVYSDRAGRAWPLAAGSLFLRRTGRLHSVRLDAAGPWAECWIVLPPEVETALAGLAILPEDRPVLEVGVDLDLVRELRRTAEVLAGAADVDLPHHLVRLTGILVSLLGRAGGPTGSFDLDRACRLLADGGRSDLRLVARELGLGWESFRKRFRERAGLAPGAYRLRRRLERAQAELLAGGRPVQAIAAELGYANPFVFSTIFHRHVGCTPTAWRRRQRG